MGSALTYLADAAVTTSKVDQQPWDAKKHRAVKAAACCMQGWRRSMEDSHFMAFNEDKNVYLFGVFDGHGGSGVSRFCAQRVPEVVFSNSNFHDNKFDIALHEAFMQVDRETQDPAVQEKLFALHKQSKDGLSKSDLDKVEIHLPFETLLDLFLGDPRDLVNFPADPFKVFMDDFTVPSSASLDEESNRSSRKRSPWAGIARRIRVEEKSSAEAIQELKSLVNLSRDQDEESPVPLLMRLREDIDWTQEKLLAKDPLPLLFEGSLASHFHLRNSSSSGITSGSTSWVYSIHPVDLLSVLSSEYLVAGGQDRHVSEEQVCTATVCLLDMNEKLVYCANAGDSRAILVRNRTAVPLSIDHKPSLKAERRRVLHAGGQVKGKLDPRVQGDLNLSRAIGDWRHKQNHNLPLELQMISPRPDITVTKLTSKDSFLVLGCDGIWERFSSLDCAAFIAAVSPLKKIGDIGKEICLQTVRKDDEFEGLPIGVTIGCDNMSVVLVKLELELETMETGIRLELEHSSLDGDSTPTTMPVISFGEQVPDDWKPSSSGSPGAAATRVSKKPRKAATTSNSSS